MAILAEGEVARQVEAGWLDPAWWQRRDAVRKELGGRGQAVLVASPIGALVLRRFRRGGLAARFSADRYWAPGRERSRGFREFRLLQVLASQGLPVPDPVAASYERDGLFYRAGLLTRLIPDACELAEVAAGLSFEQWRDLAMTLDAFFAAGLCHPDLNARNLLLDRHGRWHLLDLDRARLVGRRVDSKAMRQRLARSLGKLPDSGWRTGFTKTLGKDI
ncbi:MAG: 3-deoxy-D-manno-octulosonic acid kinase [Wenzhouxiangella sp.]